VTPVPIGFVVTWPTAPRGTQALAAWPSGNHGAKWSDTPSASNPAASAALACSINSEGGNSSVEAANQSFVSAMLRSSVSVAGVIASVPAVAEGNQRG
jgi:hypothetical protein